MSNQEDNPKPLAKVICLTEWTKNRQADHVSHADCTTDLGPTDFRLDVFADTHPEKPGRVVLVISTEGGGEVATLFLDPGSAQTLAINLLASVDHILNGGSDARD